jgi:hypothetical protein
MNATEGETEANTCSAVNGPVVGVGAVAVVVARALVVVATSRPEHAGPATTKRTRQRADRRMARS